MLNWAVSQIWYNFDNNCKNIASNLWNSRELQNKNLFFFKLQQAVQEKFRQASENIDDLNKWLDKVERDVAGQNVPQEDVDGLKNQINALKVKLL